MLTGVGADGLPNSTIYKQTTVTITESPQWYSISLSPTVKLAKGTKLAIVASTTNQYPILLKGSLTTTYPSGYVIDHQGKKQTVTGRVSITYEGNVAPEGLKYQIQLTTNNKVTWKDLISLTGAGVTSYAYDFSNEPQTSQAYVRIRAFDGIDYSLWDESNGSFTISHNSTPTLTLTSPTNNQTIKQGTDIDFKWSGSDTDGDALTYTLQVGTSAGASNIYNASVGSATSKQGISTSWAVGLYYWRVVANDGKGGVTTSTEGVFGLAQGNLVMLTKSNSVTVDTFIKQDYPTTAIGGSGVLYVGSDTTSGSTQRALLKFDLGLIPNDAIINSATLRLYKGGGNAPSRTHNIHEVTSPWDGVTTWNTAPTFNPTVASSLALGPSNDWKTFDVKTLVQAWVSGSANNGLLLKDANETTLSTLATYNSFDSTGNQPTLTIDYSIPTTGKKQVELLGNASNNQTNQSSAHIPNFPAGYQAQAGDLALIHVITYDYTVTPTNGWQIIRQAVAPSGHRYTLAYKFLAASEVASVALSSPSSIGWHSKTLILRNVKAIKESSYRGIADQTAYYPFDAGTSKTLSVDKAMMLLFNFYAGTANTFTQPLSYAEPYDDISSGYRQQAAYRYMHMLRTQTMEETTSTLSGASAGSSMFVALEPIVNNPPTLTLTSPANNQTLAEGSVYKLEGTVSDVEAGSALSVKYSIAGGPTQTIAIGTSDGSNPNPFSKTLTYSQGRFWDGQTDVSGLLPADASSILVWANDGTDDSAKQTRNFKLQQEDGKIYVPVNVVSSGYLVSKMARPSRLANGKMAGLSRDSNKWYLYQSLDNGATWSLAFSFNFTSIQGISLSAFGNFIYLAVAFNNQYVRIYAYDNFTYAGEVLVESGQNAIASVSTIISPDGTKLLWSDTTKNVTYPDSFNVRAGSIPINTDGTLGTPSATVQVTSTNASGYDHTSPSLCFDKNGRPVIAYVFASVHVQGRLFNGTNWGDSFSIYNSVSHTQASPEVIKSPNGKLHAVWHGTDFTSPSEMIRYSSSVDSSQWATHKILVAGKNPSITSDKNGKLTIIYEDGGYIKRIESTNDFTSFSGPFIDRVGTNPATFYDQSFATDFSIPPTIYQTTDAVKYRGVLNLNKRPAVTLNTPDNQTLTENKTLMVSGQTVDEDAGNVITVWYKVNNGPAQAAASSISDGSTPILFDKTLTYKNKRIYLGTTDLNGIDLAENTDHILTVWAEDNKQGKSLEVTRKFRVVWNRPPVIDDENKDLGVFMQPPTVNYHATDPEGNTFTFTEYLNGKQIRSFAGVAGQVYTVEISHDAWIRLDLDVQHQIKIVPTDSAGISSERIYTFTRKETHIEFMLEYGNPDIKADFTLDGMPLRVLVTLERYLPEGSSIESVKVCNNYLDDVPTWEDCTGAVKGNRGYLFTNKNKTAPEWAINLWVTIDKGTAKERVLLNGYGGAFD
ncbi:DNRLRE domain-containing protein [Brevibacillus brevis]|nr:DNRLRE domain-containing protein [Brevibacillus brevis]